jgi:hypothetical protein
MFMRVISACRTGRFFFGNGAMWYILDDQGRQVMIDTVNGTTTFVPDYMPETDPHTNESTARSIEEFLMNSSAGYVSEGELPRYQAMDMIRRATADGGLWFTNGCQWYIEYCGGIQAVELLSTSQVKVKVYSQLASYQYKRWTGKRAVVTSDIKQFLDIA